MAAHRTFPSTVRLVRKQDFDALFRAPAMRLRSPPLRMLARPNERGVPRLGIVAPKRSLRRAIDRNRAKRIVRESFRLARSRLPPCDFVVTVDGAEAESVRKAAEELWLRLDER